MLCTTAINTSNTIKAKFHYTGPMGPDRTDFVGDPHGPNGVSRRPGPQKSPCGSGRFRSGRVVEFSRSPTKCADFVWSGPVGFGRARVVEFSYKNTASAIPVAVTRLQCRRRSFVHAAQPSIVQYTNRPFGHQRRYTKHPAIRRQYGTI